LVTNRGDAWPHAGQKWPAGPGLAVRRASDRQASRSLLQDPSYRRAAAAAGARLRSRNGAIAAADELEGILTARKDSTRGFRRRRARALWRRGGAALRSGGASSPPRAGSGAG